LSAKRTTPDNLLTFKKSDETLLRILRKIANPNLAMIYHLIFFSIAQKAMSDDELFRIIKASREWNEAHGLTGKLVYIEGESDQMCTARFMQALEGAQTVVQATFDKIKLDRRHVGITLLTEGYRRKRSFHNWSVRSEKIDLEQNPAFSLFFKMKQSIISCTQFRQADTALNFLKAF
jgi:hypothetical protein